MAKKYPLMDMGQNIFLVILWSQSNALVNKSLSFYKYIILQVPVKKALDYINLNQAINGVWFFRSFSFRFNIRYYQQYNKYHITSTKCKVSPDWIYNVW